MKYKLAESLSIRKIENELFILNRKDSRLHTFNESGIVLWEAMQHLDSSEPMVETLLNKYEVDRETAEKDVVGFLSEMQELHLLEIL